MDAVTVESKDGSTTYKLDVDKLIAQLLVNDKGSRRGAQIDIEFDAIHALLAAARKILMQQPMLLELDAPLNIMGDLHAQFGDLKRLLEIGGLPPDSNYLFLGDYVDRAQNGIETVCLLLCYKVKFPENFFLLRGNHESASINRIYGFYDECKRRFNVRLWKMFGDLFNCLPVAALVSDRIFCMHGGLSQELIDIHDINDIMRPCEIPDEGILCDLLWADPCEDHKGFVPSDRGVSFSFGEDFCSSFVQKNGFDIICRAHQVVEDGYEFFANRQLVTLFSAPNYCGEFDNAAAMMSVNEDLMCSFQILKARQRTRRASLADIAASQSN